MTSCVKGLKFFELYRRVHTFSQARVLGAQCGHGQLSHRDGGHQRDGLCLVALQCPQPGHGIRSVQCDNVMFC